MASSSVKRPNRAAAAPSYTHWFPTVLLEISKLKTASTSYRSTEESRPTRIRNMPGSTTAKLGNSSATAMHSASTAVRHTGGGSEGRSDFGSNFRETSGNSLLNYPLELNSNHPSAMSTSLTRIPMLRPFPPGTGIGQHEAPASQSVDSKS